MAKIAIDAGHALTTAGKQTPDGEKEWSFNNKVAIAAINKLNTYENVQILRLDDPTGRLDIPLVTRTNKANAWGADVLVSIHHNAHLGVWGSHGGVETYTQPGSSKASKDIAAFVHPRIVQAMGLRNRGLKTSNLHMTREAKMPAILTEGGFMDSLTDILVMRNDTKLKEQGEAIAEGLAVYFKLKPKTSKVEQVSNPVGVVVYRYGDVGPGVGKLQADLNKTGAQLVVDNSFGPAVRAAVGVFQAKYGLTVDRIAGPLTLAKLAEVTKPKPIPKPAPKPKPAPTPAPTPKPKSAAQTKGDIYRVIVDGKQKGAFGEPSNVANAVRQGVEQKAKEIKIQKV
ncbi:N-acetylmuramoyl-L-alanine amidase [Sporosarcina jiandibaonis]|uniref:N-acetylmuramoyl-L-alanine amidase n=1 Tax=Sporosarcina jiandibaonis TaxID=2715535 RepID=UPI0015559FAD|nr:N-acetylmuramoyl-L-alanine amidase [Sporosarcina jiandibaonis]